MLKRRKWRRRRSHVTMTLLLINVWSVHRVGSVQGMGIAVLGVNDLEGGLVCKYPPTSPSTWQQKIRWDFLLCFHAKVVRNNKMRLLAVFWSQMFQKKIFFVKKKERCRIRRDISFHEHTLLAYFIKLHGCIQDIVMLQQFCCCIDENILYPHVKIWVLIKRCPSCTSFVVKITIILSTFAWHREVIFSTVTLMMIIDYIIYEAYASCGNSLTALVGRIRHGFCCW